MKIVDATWEKRNLLLETKEITVEENDTLEELDAALKEATEEYVVVKLPSLHPEKRFLLTEYRFTHVEAMAEVERRLSSLPPLSKTQQEISDRVSAVPASRESIKEILSWVSGTMFDTDRISQDPYFPPGLAGRRYIGWICDEIARGGEIWHLVMDQTPIGFFSNKYVNENRCSNFLSGIYPEFQGKGLGFLRGDKFRDFCTARGIDCTVADISTNNIRSLKDALHTGCTISRLTHIYVKHNLPREEYWKRIETHKDTLISEALTWTEL